MIRTTVIADKNIIIVYPEGSLSTSDFDGLSKVIDDYVNENDKVPALVIQADEFPHWASFGALIRHLKLIKSHQRVIPKIAVVSDHAGLSALPGLADHFVKAKIRHFSILHALQAVEWAEAEDDDPGSFEVMDPIASNVVAIRVQGIITAQDYQETLLPLIVEKLKIHDKVNVLIVAGDDYESITGGALWSDARFGLAHLFGFGKIAFVSDVEALRIGMKLCGPFIPAKVHVFHLAELEDAKAWVKR